MATHSIIIVPEPKPQLRSRTKNPTAWRGVTVRFDGFPEGVGKTLTDHHNTDGQAADLVALGHLQTLGESLTQESGTCVWVRHDEADNQPLAGDTPEAVMRQAAAAGCEYAYVRRGGVWETHETFGWGV